MTTLPTSLQLWPLVMMVNYTPVLLPFPNLQLWPLVMKVNYTPVLLPFPNLMVLLASQFSLRNCKMVEWHSQETVYCTVMDQQET